MTTTTAPTKVSVTIPVTTEHTVRNPVSEVDFVPTEVDWEGRVHQGGISTTCWVYGSIGYDCLVLHPNRESVPGFLPQPPHWFWATLSDMTTEQVAW